MKHYRQGDVLLLEIKSIPKGAVELPRDDHNRIVLATGEMTGHAHAIRNPSVCSLARDEGGPLEFLTVIGGADLYHELVSGAKAEHDAIQLPSGKYRLARQVEYSPAELKKVSD